MNRNGRRRWTRSCDWSRHRRRTIVVEDTFHTGCITLPIDLVPIRGTCFPKHNTPKILRIHIHILCYQGLNLVRLQVEPLDCHFRAGWQTNQQFCFRVGAVLDDSHPVIIVESRISVPFNEVPGRAAFGVVELDPDKIERGIRNSIV